MVRRIGLVILVCLLASPHRVWSDPSPAQVLTIATDGTREVLHGQRLRLVLNANRCILTLDGKVDSVIVNGSRNQVSVRTRPGRVVINGDHNVLIYSSQANPVGPNVEDDGNDNTVRAGS